MFGSSTLCNPAKSSGFRLRGCAAVGDGEGDGLVVGVGGGLAANAVQAANERKMKRNADFIKA
jgi:hypothetical protein